MHRRRRGGLQDVTELIGGKVGAFPVVQSEPVFLHVKRVLHLKDYTLRVEFTDGVVKDVDLREELHGEIFEPLKNSEFFRQATVNEETETVEWSNGADFAPEFLYEIGKKVKQIA